MDIDKFIVTATLILFDVFLTCFTLLVLMIIADGIKEWRSKKRAAKQIKPTVPRDKEHG